MSSKLSRFLKKNWKKLLTLFVVVAVCVAIIMSINISPIDHDISRDETSIVVDDSRNEFIEDSITDDRLVSIGDGGTHIETNKPNNEFVGDTVSESKHEISSGNRVISSGSNTEKDKYITDAIPEGRPNPVNVEDQKVNNEDYFYVYLSIDCETILDHMDDLSPGLDKYVGNGTILEKTQVKCYDGESVYDILVRECKSRGINLESTYEPIFGTAYIEAINNIAEKDCGELSGWCYSVDDWFPNYGCSRYVLVEGEYIRFRYSCEGLALM